MRIGFIGTVDFSERLLHAVLRESAGEVVGVVTRRTSPFNADHRSLAALAESASIPCLELDANDPEHIGSWLADRQPEILYCFGWSFLLGPELLRLAPMGVVGYHPAPLPVGRGRHPIIWAIVLGLEQTASTFFQMDEGADSGPILSQEPVPIGDADAGVLYARLADTATEQVARVTRALAAGTCQPVPQDHDRAISWRKRTIADGRIDWRMPADGIVRLVRGLARPYPGAHYERGGEHVRVWRAEVSDRPFPGERWREPGRVLEVAAGTFCVRTGAGVLRVTETDAAPQPEPGEAL